ncbi:MAG TPA: class I SAM-dependent methyltransferase [Myxococcota bacterium]|nr:class I SAM-dependent methyltransferase [Myxococcota bacterium]
MDQTQSIQARFGAAAAAYAVSAVHRAGLDLDAMLAAGVATGRERVLDLGCGPGATALAFAARAASVVALDLTPAMLEQARRLAAERGLANIRFEQGNAAKLPFADASFDVVTSRFSAHHVAEPAAMVREAARVLAPRGTFLLSDTISPEDPARDSFLNAFELLRDPSHVRDHRVSEWEAMFRAAGLAPSCLGRFDIRQDFEPWVARIGTSPEAVTGLRALFDAAPDEVRAHFDIRGRGDYAFRLDCAVLCGVRP